MKQEEKKSYFKTIFFIMMIDENISFDEVELFGKIGISAGLSFDEINNIQNTMDNNGESLQMIVAGIKDYTTKIELLGDLLSLCYADGEYSIAEQLGIRDICGILDIDISDLLALEDEARTAYECKSRFLKGSNFFNDVIDSISINSAVVGAKVKLTGKSLAHSISKGVNLAGSKISSFSIEGIKRLKKENEELREHLKTNVISEATKQKIILQLNSKIEILTAQLKAEKERNIRNEEIITYLEAQINELIDTIEFAENIEPRGE